MLKELQKGICQVRFKKVKDNSIRTILCTLLKGTIPARFEKTVDSIYTSPVDPDIVAIWDIEEGKWKSFKLSRVIEFRDPDEIKKNIKPGHLVKAKLADTLEEMKNDVMENYQKTIERQLEESQRIKNTMKG